MTLQQIKYILGVAEAGSLNKASERLFISQPSLSSSVHDAENELGFQIFFRNARGVKPTEQGESFIRDARILYTQYEDLLKKHCKTQTDRVKNFSVSTLYYSFARKAFVQIVNEYSKNSESAEGGKNSKGAAGEKGRQPGPKYDFSFCEKKASDVIMDVASEKSSIGILYLSEANRDSITRALENAALEFHHLTECNAFVYLHKNHPLSKNESLSLEELKPYHFVTFDTDDVRSFFSEEVIARYGLDKAITVADRSTELSLLEHLKGYTFLSGVFEEVPGFELGEGADTLNAAAGENSEDFLLIPLKNPDGKISHCFELGYITKRNTRLDNISLKYIDLVRRILNIAGFTC